MPFIPLSVPNIKGNEIKYVTKVLEEEWVSTAGQCINDFEDLIAKYVKADYACACQSGTAGLHLCLRTFGIEQNDIVLVPTLTFIATINSIMYQKAQPVFFDCDENLCMDVNQIEKYLKEDCTFDGKTVVDKTLNKQVKAIVPVHIFGAVTNMEKIMELSRKYNLYVIEDATESLGTEYTDGCYTGKFSGTIADAGVFSFNGNKIITTGGGGMVVSNNKEIIDRVRYLSTQAKDDMVYFIHNEVGYNYRMTNLQAALGIAQLEQLDKFIETKKQNYDYYVNKFQGDELAYILPFSSGIRPNYWFYSMVLKKPDADLRDKIIAYFNENGIQTRPIWKLNHTQKPFEKFKCMSIDKAKIYYDSIINLPCSSNLTKEDIDTIFNCYNKFKQEELGNGYN